MTISSNSWGGRLSSSVPLATFLVLVSINSFCVALPPCSQGTTHGFAGREDISNDWSAFGCAFVGTADSTADNNVNYFRVLIGTTKSDGVRNVHLNQVSFQNLQFAFSVDLANSTRQPFRLVINSCTFAVDRIQWSYLFIFTSKPMPQGSEMTFLNNSFHLITLKSDDSGNYFALMLFYVTQWDNISATFISNNVNMSSTYHRTVYACISVLQFGFEKGEVLNMTKGSKLSVNNNNVTSTNAILAADFDPKIFAPIIILLMFGLSLQNASAIEMRGNIANMFMPLTYDLRLEFNFVIISNLDFTNSSTIRLADNIVSGVIASVTLSMMHVMLSMTLRDQSSVVIENCTVNITTLTSLDIYITILSLERSIYSDGGRTGRLSLCNNTIIHDAQTSLVAVSNRTRVQIAVFLAYGQLSNEIRIKIASLELNHNTIYGTGNLFGSNPNRSTLINIFYTYWYDIEIITLLLINNRIQIDYGCATQTCFSNVQHNIGIWYSAVCDLQESQVEVADTFVSASLVGVHMVETFIVFAELTGMVASHLSICRALVESTLNTTSLSDIFTGGYVSVTTLLQNSTITVAELAIKQNSFANTTAPVQFGGKCDFKNDTTILVYHCSIFISVDNANSNITLAFFAFVSSTTVQLADCTFQIVNNNLTVTPAQKALIPITHQPLIKVYGLSLMAKNSSLGNGTRILLSGNAIEALNVSTALLYIESLQLQVAPTTDPSIGYQFLLERNIISASPTNSFLIAFSVQAVLAVHPPFIALCRNYRNGYPDESLGGVGLGRHLITHGPQCNTLSYTISQSYTVTNRLTFSQLLSSTTSVSAGTLSSSHSHVPPEPSTPSDFEIAKENSEAVLGAVIAAGGGILFPKAAGQASIAMASLRVAARCQQETDETDEVEKDDDEPLSPFLHPLRFALGSGPSRYYAGAVIGNCLLLPLIAATILWGTMPFVLRWLLPNTPSRDEILVFQGWPSSLVQIVPPLIEGTTASVATLIASGDPIEMVIGFAGALVIGIVFGMWAYVLLKKVSCHSLTLVRASDQLTSFSWPFLPLYERVRADFTTCNAEVELALSRWAPLFGDSVFLWSGWVGSVLGAIVGVVEGLGADHLPCASASTLLLVFAIFQSLVACTTMVPAELVVEATAGICLLLLCSCALHTQLQGDAFLSSDNQNVLGLVINVLGLFGLMVGITEAIFKVLRLRAATLLMKCLGFELQAPLWSAYKMISAPHDSDNEVPLANINTMAVSNEPMDVFLESIYVEVLKQQQAKKERENKTMTKC